jgi:drug/metabolite transporter (DMT)-like permease
MGVMRIGPKAAGYFGNLFPVFGSALGIILLGEPFRWFLAVGGLITLSGIYLATVTGRKQTASCRAGLNVAA